MEEQNPQDILSRIWKGFKKVALYFGLFIFVYAVLKVSVLDVFEIHVLPVLGLAFIISAGIIFYIKNKN